MKYGFIHILRVLIPLTLLTCHSSFATDCLKQQDENGAFWARNLGRSQVSGFIQHSASSYNNNIDKAWFYAKGRALSDLAAECGNIPDDVKAFEKCESSDSHVYIRYSVKHEDCGKDNSKTNILLTDLLKKYNDEILLNKSINTKNCLSKADDCLILANALIANSKKEEALSILKMSCELNKYKACFAISRLLLSDKIQSAKNYYLKGCQKSPKKDCYQYGFLFEKNKKQYLEVLLGACDLGEGRSCYRLTEIDERFDVKKNIIKSCINGSKEGCLKLSLMNLSKNEVEAYRSDFCSSGIDKYCKKSNTERYDLMDNLDDEEESIKPLKL